MKRSYIKKQGSTGKANSAARKIIAQIAEEKGLNYCEVQLEGCTHTWPLAPAHRHRRNHYKGDVEAMSDFNEWVAACQSCHLKMDARTEEAWELTEEIFDRLRG